MINPLVPPGFALEDLRDQDGREIAADFWEELGESGNAEILRIRVPESEPLDEDWDTIAAYGALIDLFDRPDSRPEP